MKKERRNQTVNIRVTPTTKENLEMLMERTAERTGYPASQSDVISRLISIAAQDDSLLFKK